MREKGLIIDLFAGGGGASLGLEMALGRAVDVAINHSPEAVAIHAANHPGTRHFVQNICAVLPRDTTGGRAVDVLWASPDCTHFSKAKGAAPKQRNIRELAWAVIRWARDTKPKLICVENVEEFQTWGPIDGNGRPIKEKTGETFRRWVRALESEGYRVEWNLLRACDYGAPTIRRRLFIVARRDRKPIVWPSATHGPGRANPWRTAAECIDWNIETTSIFDRKKPLAENTLKRIAEGLRRFVIESDRPFVMRPDPSALILQGVIGGEVWLSPPTICQSGSHQQLVSSMYSPFVQHIQHGSRGITGVMDASLPLRTITAYPKGGGMALVAASLVHYYGHKNGPPRCGDLASPFRTATASGNRFGLTTASLAPLLIGAGGPSYGGKPVSLARPMGTITIENHKALVAAYLSHFYGTMQDGRLVSPMKTVTSGGLHSGLVSVFLSHYYGSSIGCPLWAPAFTATAKNKLGLVSAFLTKYYGTGGCHDLDVPFGTLTTRERYGLVTVHSLPLLWVEGEPYVIADIGLRMLTPRELARAQGFPDGYIFNPLFQGKPLTQKAQVAAIGNSVPPVFSDALIRANKDALDYVPRERTKAKMPSLLSALASSRDAG